MVSSPIQCFLSAGIAFASKIFMSHQYFSIKFNHDDIHYDGIVTPSEKVRDDGTPKSFHVVRPLQSKTNSHGVN